jgi:antitoxin ParD1/3/4
MIERLVRSGRYQNASEVLRDGLRLVQQREAEDKACLAALRQAAKTGLEDLAAGRYRDFADGEALRSHLAARAATVLAAHVGAQAEAERIFAARAARAKPGTAREILARAGKRQRPRTADRLDAE